MHVQYVAVCDHVLVGADGKPSLIGLIITDPKGNEIARPSGEIGVPPAPAGIDSLAIDLPMLLDMFGLPEFGRYTFMLSIDGEPKAGVQIAVRQGQAQLT